MAVVLNDNGVVVDHSVITPGGFIPREKQDDVLDALTKLAEQNRADVVVMNTALGLQTVVIQRLLASQLHSHDVVLVFHSFVGYS